jgi:hypothetical protein
MTNAEKRQLNEYAKQNKTTNCRLLLSPIFFCFDNLDV